MKLIILHLSDMHFSKKNSYQPVNIDAIVAALQQSVFEVQHIIILVSGDLAYSGKKSECFQVLHFFNSIKAAIKSRYGILDIKICVVPGNHDIDYLKGDRGASGLANIEDHRSYDKHISEELEKQEQFYILARRYNCFKQSGLVDKRIFIYGEKKIQVNLINTAIFSSLDNDQGFHYIPMSDIVTLKDQNDSDFIFSVMHHPHHWYSASCKKQLEEALYSRSDIVFVGHEHYESTQKVEGEDSSVNIFAAGKLCDQGNWADSEFHIGLLDLETREYISKKYHLNTKRMIYECIGTDKPVSLSRNRYNSLGLTLSSEYTQKLFEDKYLLSQDVLEYFVFPLLFEERITEGNGKLPEEISDFDSLWTRIQSKQKTIISGYNGAGKSVLARAIFREVSQSKITIFIEGKQYSGTNEGMIRDAFERMYSKNPTDYQAFLQKKPEDLIIIIDDIDAIKLKLKPLSDEQALSVLRWEALSMLLELMNSSFANATRANTIDFIDAFPYNTETAYGVEHIISLDRRDDLTRFYKEAIKLFEDTDLPMVKSSVQRVAKHFLIKSKKVKASDRDRFNAKIFAQGLNKGKLLEETTRSRGKK